MTTKIFLKLIAAGLIVLACALVTVDIAGMRVIEANYHETLERLMAEKARTVALVVGQRTIHEISEATQARVTIVGRDGRVLSDSARKQMELIASVKRQIAEIDGDSKRAQAESESMIRDQERLRQNINSLNQVSGQQQQVQAYAKQLADQESKLAALRDRASELQRKRVALDGELNSLIEKTEF